MTPGPRVYVYGVIAGSRAGVAATTGVEGCAVRAVACGGLAALVSNVSGSALAVARDVRAHWRVLEAAFEQATVLPVRFGTVMESDRAVCEQLLEPNAASLEGLLDRLAGRVQLSVKGDYDEDALLRTVVSSSPEIARLRERIRTLPDAAGYYGRIRLGEMVAQQVARRRDDDTRIALERLSPLAVQARSEEPSSTGQAFDLAFLVERAGTDAFSRAVADLADEVGERARIRYVGPLPPYGFIDVELTSGSPAWA